MSAREGAVRRLVGSAAFALGPAQLDDDRLQRPPGAPVDGDDPARGRRRVAHARNRLVLEQQLAAPDVVSLGNVHGGAQPHRIGGHQRGVARFGSRLDLLYRRAGERQPETLPEGVETHLRRTAERCAGDL